MPVRATPLTAAKVRTAGPGRYGDGDGLYLLVRDNGTAFWNVRYVLPRDSAAPGADQPQKKPKLKMREIGLGRARGQNAVSLTDARTAAVPLHRLVRNKVDPLEQRNAEAQAARAAAQAAKARAITFKTVAGMYIESHEAGCRNAKHAAQWRATLETYATLTSATCQSVGWASPRSWRRCSRSGKPNRRRQAGCAAASRQCWTTPRRASGDLARIPRRGVAI